MRHIFPALLVVAAIAISGYFYWTYGRETTPIASTAQAASGLEEDADALTGRDDIYIMGVVVPTQHAALAMGNIGKVGEVLVKEGDDVVAGEIIARLENGEYEANVAQATAKLSAAEAELAKVQAGARPEEILIAQSALTITLANLAQATEASLSVNAATRENAISKTIAEAEVQRAQAQLDLLQNGPRPEEVAAAQAAVSEARAELQSAQSALSRTELRAPFTGTVGSMELKVGQQVGYADVVVELADLSEWQIESDELDELRIVHVKEGDPVTIHFDALPDLELTGTVTHVRLLGNPDGSEVTYSVVVKPDGFDPNVRWNMTSGLVITPRE